MPWMDLGDSITDPIKPAAHCAVIERLIAATCDLVEQT